MLAVERPKMPIFERLFNALANIHQNYERKNHQNLFIFRNIKQRALQKTLKAAREAKITIIKYLHSTLENEKKNAMKKIFYQYRVKNQFFGLAQGWLWHTACYACTFGKHRKA
jgi:hypothetical protein